MKNVDEEFVLSETVLSLKRTKDMLQSSAKSVYPQPTLKTSGERKGKRLKIDNQPKFLKRRKKTNAQRKRSKSLSVDFELNTRVSKLGLKEQSDKEGGERKSNLEIKR